LQHPVTSKLPSPPYDKSTSTHLRSLCFLYLLRLSPVCTSLNGCFRLSFILRKEVIQPHLPIRLPCYDFTPIIRPTFGGWFHKMVTSPTSGVANSRGVTGGVYKARERIHRGMLIRDYYRFLLPVGELQPTFRTENGFVRFAPPCGFAALCSIHCSTCVAQVIRGMII